MVNITPKDSLGTERTPSRFATSVALSMRAGGMTEAQVAVAIGTALLAQGVTRNEGSAAMMGESFARKAWEKWPTWNPRMAEQAREALADAPMEEGPAPTSDVTREREEVEHVASDGGAEEFHAD
jgi:hypothetical protein